MKKIHLVTDSIHGSVRVSSIEKRIISMPVYSRLHGISQNSTAYLTFPSNRTTRYEHSIGTMHLCGKTYFSGICNALPNVKESFFLALCCFFEQELEKLKQDKEFGNSQGANLLDDVFKKIKSEHTQGVGQEEFHRALIQNDSLFDIYSPSLLSGSSFFAYQVSFQAIRLVALLHDLGHPPFSHVVEEALENVLVAIKQKSSSGSSTLNHREKSFLAIYDQMGSSGKLHERISIKLTQRILDDKNYLDVTTLKTETDWKSSDNVRNAIYEYIYAYLVKQTALAILDPSNQTNEIRSMFCALHSIVSGTIDGDRLDYCCRDHINSGLSNNRIDFERLLSSVCLILDANKYYFAPSIDNVKIVNEVLERRWSVYEHIVFHHRVLRTDTVLKNIVEKMAFKYLSDDNPPEDDEDSLPYNISGLWRAFESTFASSKSIDKLIQWDDHWLLTILKREYIMIRRSNPDNQITTWLEEFLTNSKNHYTLAKTLDDYFPIDSSALQHFIELMSHYNTEYKGRKSRPKAHLINSINELTARYTSAKANPVTYGDMHGIFTTLATLAIRAYSSSCGVERSVVEYIQSKIDDITYSGSVGIKESFVISRTPSDGIADGITMYKPIFDDPSKQYELVSLEDVSMVSTVLKEKLHFIPIYHVYMRRAKMGKDVNYIQIKSDVGIWIAEALYHCLLSI